ncbi:I78 family peptidase inhibitor [Aestuariibius sp. HNIBRBA575]|uniref:I78 family peptidase inhibitor n=1 Tax=Aestuariibius sp. HNIBRBA575 TaxID=3233343 RepID=UPI0034A5B015
MKNLTKFPLMLICALGVAACAGMQPDPIAPPVAQDTCDAQSYVDYVGRDATDLERVLILKPVRIIRPETAVTMDFSAERLNFHIDSANRIIRITCG